MSRKPPPAPALYVGNGLSINPSLSFNEVRAACADLGLEFWDSGSRGVVLKTPEGRIVKLAVREDAAEDCIRTFQLYSTFTVFPRVYGFVIADDYLAVEMEYLEPLDDGSKFYNKLIYAVSPWDLEEYLGSQPLELLDNLRGGWDLHAGNVMARPGDPDEIVFIDPRYGDTQSGRRVASLTSNGFTDEYYGCNEAEFWGDLEVRNLDQLRLELAA